MRPDFHVPLWQTGMVTCAWNPTTGKAAICWLLGLTVKWPCIKKTKQNKKTKQWLCLRNKHWGSPVASTCTYPKWMYVYTQTQVHAYMCKKKHRYTHMGGRGEKGENKRSIQLLWTDWCVSKYFDFWFFETGLAAHSAVQWRPYVSLMVTSNVCLFCSTAKCRHYRYWPPSSSVQC